MGRSVDEEILVWVNEKHDIPKKTRQKLDSTYAQIIREKKVVKPKIRWRKTVSMMALATILGLFFLTNSQVLATLNQWFNFSSQWKYSLGEDILLTNGKSQSNKDMEIVINQNVSTPYSIGFEFTLKSKGDYKFSKNTTVWLDYVIKNGDGTEIISQSEEGKNKAEYNDLTYLQNMDTTVSKDGAILKSSSYHFLRDINEQQIPLLKNATLEVSKVSIPSENMEFKGSWSIPLKDGNPNQDYSPKTYQVATESKDIQIKSAILTKTNFVITYKFNKEMSISDMELLNSYVQDDECKKYKNNQYSLEENNTWVKVNIPLTSSEAPKNMTFVVEKINGEAKIDVPLVRE